MADYGLTPQGPNIKRLDVILNELHDSMTEKLGNSVGDIGQQMVQQRLWILSRVHTELFGHGVVQLVQNRRVSL